MADEMSLAEAVNICKRLQGEYRAFEKAADAANVVQRAHTEIQAFQRNAAKAKADLQQLEGQVAAAREAKKAADGAKNEAEAARKLAEAELGQIRREFDAAQSKLETQKKRAETDHANLKAKMAEDLDRQRAEKTAAIEADIQALEKKHQKLMAAIADLTGQRDALKARVEQAQQTLQ